MFYRSTTLAALACLGLSGPAAAQGFGPDVSEVTLLQGWRMENGRHMAGLQIRLEPGWKTYWRAPGSNGIPPSFDWSGSRNIRSVKVHWPRPSVYDSYGEATIGYKDMVVMPLEVTPIVAGQPMEMALELFFGVCDEVCIPSDAEVNTLLGLGTTPSMGTIRDALAAAPTPAQASGVTSVTCALDPGSDGIDIEARVGFDRPVGGKPLSIIETGSDTIWATSATTRVEGDKLVISARLKSYETGPLLVNRSALRLTLLGAGTAVDIQGCPSG